MLGPRKRPTPPQLGETTAPAAGRPTSHVELPERPPHAAREPELEHRHRPAGPDDADELAQRRGHVVDVAEQVGEGDGVELPVRERQSLGSPSRSSIRSLRPARATRSRPAASISGLWSTPTTVAGRIRARELDRHRCGAASRRRALDVRRAGSARRGRSASAGPGRTRAGGRSGRTSGRAARTARARDAYAAEASTALFWPHDASPRTSGASRARLPPSRSPGRSSPACSWPRRSAGASISARSSRPEGVPGSRSATTRSR